MERREERWRPEVKNKLRAAEMLLHHSERHIELEQYELTQAVLINTFARLSGAYQSSGTIDE